MDPVELGLILSAVAAVIALLAGGFSGEWRIALRLFLSGLGFAAVEVAVITYVPAVGIWVMEVRSR